MSLVGTRPPTVDEWDKYELHHRARLATKPGLTGMWQVSGRSNITDLWYSSRYSFCFFICMHIIRSTPERESKPPALLGFVHLRILCFFVNYFAFS